MLSLITLALLASSATAQLAGTQQTETHPTLTTQKCTKSGGCTTQQTKVVLDSNWRWTHVSSGYTNCYTGNEWNSTVCTSPTACAQNCALEGVDYSGTYGIQASGNSLSMRFVTNHQYGTNVGSRVYLMENDSKYMMIQLKNQEFAFDVDVSKLPCGLNGALYLSSMDADGGMSKYSGNKAGAKFGTGYCDAQCPHDMKWINGEANTLDWAPSESDENAGVGRYGTCCDEMDIWESNSMGTAYTPHSCSSTGQTRCSGTQCGDNGPTRYQGICDKDGCDFNSYRMGDTTFYGKGKKVNSNNKMTVVTQFLTTDGTANGALREIRRLYVQNGVVIQNSKSNVAGVTASDSITTQFCNQVKSAFGDEPEFQALGGMAKMGNALGSGMVLSMSIWADHYAHMLWLDSSYPTNRPSTDPGVKRGECATDSGDPDTLVANSPDATVVYSNIKWGDIGSTYAA